MKTTHKALLLMLCAILLVGASVLGTMAYLTSNDTVTNTFTVGKVAITLDESPVLTDGTLDDTQKKEDEYIRRKSNTYKLMPGHTYVKDPIVHVADDSESCYVFIKVKNDIAALEAASENLIDGYKDIDSQIIENGWIIINTGEEVTDVASTTKFYYKIWDSTTNAGDKELEVFDDFKISETVDSTILSEYVPTDSNHNGTIDEGEYKSLIEINAYAIQKDGFTNETEAWTALMNQMNPPTTTP